MELNSARRTALLTAINADGALAALPKSTAAATRIARDFNQNSAPAVIVWKSSVTKSEVLEMVAIADLTGLTADQRDVLRIYLAGEEVPCNRARVRAAFATLFGATQTATRLLALWKRTATRLEAVFATGGDGSDANPHTLAVEGEVDAATVELVRT
jgi:hypothetical protein